MFTVADYLLQIYSLLLDERSIVWESLGHLLPHEALRHRRAVVFCDCGFRRLPPERLTADAAQAADCFTSDSCQSKAKPNIDSCPAKVHDGVVDCTANGNVGSAVVPSGSLDSSPLDLLDDHVLRLVLSNLSASDIQSCINVGSRSRLPRVARWDALQHHA